MSGPKSLLTTFQGGFGSFNYKQLIEVDIGDAFIKAFLPTTNLTVSDMQNKHGFEYVRKLCRDNWNDSCVYALVYIIVIFSLQYLMKSYEKFQLRGLLALWNFGLAGFSILGTVRVLPELVHVLRQKDGFHHSVCTSGYYENKVLVYWTALFALSKVVELGDTIFIIVRKQPLRFLHWYHHVTVLIFSWYTGVEWVAYARYYTAVNFLIHSYMYTYYFIKTVGVKISKPIAMAITSSQLLQMVVGLTVTSYALHCLRNDIPCEANYNHIYAGLGIYFSYFLLFTHFFYEAYISKSKNKNKAKSKSGYCDGDGGVSVKKWD